MEREDARKLSPDAQHERRRQVVCVRIPVKWAGDSGDVGQSRSEATLVVFLH